MYSAGVDPRWRLRSVPLRVRLPLRARGVHGHVPPPPPDLPAAAPWYEGRAPQERRPGEAARVPPRRVGVPAWRGVGPARGNRGPALRGARPQLGDDGTLLDRLYVLHKTSRHVRWKGIVNSYPAECRKEKACFFLSFFLSFFFFFFRGKCQFKSF